MADRNRHVPDCRGAGDAAKRDEDGYFWIIGRTDDVIKVSGHRLGTAEVESALASHQAVAEAAVIGLPHPVKGNAITAIVVLNEGYTESRELTEISAAILPCICHRLRSRMRLSTSTHCQRPAPARSCALYFGPGLSARMRVICQPWKVKIGP